MTLIASTLNYKTPIVISDLLWSSEESIVSLRLPTNLFDPLPYLPNDMENKPARLIQKMYFVNDNICIVFAGVSDEILTFLTVIKETFATYYDVTKDDIHSFLQKYELSENFLGSAFFITHIEHKEHDSIQVNQFYCPSETNQVSPPNFIVKDDRWNIQQDPIYEAVSACGEGADDFLKIIREEVQYKTALEKGDFMRAIQSNTILISKLLTMERANLYTTIKNWGGGFEIAYYNGTKFEKLNNIAYIISHGQFDDNGDIGLPIPMLIMYYKYVNDILYIVSLEAHKYSIEEENDFIIFTSNTGEFYTTIFEIEGIDIVNIHDFEMPTDFSFVTHKASMGYLLLTKGNAICNPALFGMGPLLEVHFQQNKKLQVLISRSIVNDINSYAKTAYTNMI